MKARGLCQLRSTSSKQRAQFAGEEGEASWVFSALPGSIGGQDLAVGGKGGLHEDDNDGSGMGGMAGRDFFFLSKESIQRAEKGIKCLLTLL